MITLFILLPFDAHNLKKGGAAPGTPHTDEPPFDGFLSGAGQAFYFSIVKTGVL